MKIAEMLDPKAVVADLSTSSKHDVLAELAEAIASAHRGLRNKMVLSTLLEREKLGSTGVGDGIAIPHGKISGLEQIILGFGRSIPGVNYDAIDQKPVNLFFVLLAPEDSPGTHLKALARISRLLKDGSFRERLMKAASTQEILDVIHSEDEAIG